MVDERLDRLPHRPELARADVVRLRARSVTRTQTGVSQVVRVHELISVVAAAEDVHRRTFGDEFEEDREDAEPAVAENRAWSHDAHVESRGRGLMAQLLGAQLRSAIRLERPAGGILANRIRLGYAEHRARRRVDDLGDA